jgi:hypothetical protein
MNSAAGSKRHLLIRIGLDLSQGHIGPEECAAAVSAMCRRRSAAVAIGATGFFQKVKIPREICVVPCNSAARAGGF